MCFKKTKQMQKEINGLKERLDVIEAKENLQFACDILYRQIKESVKLFKTNKFKKQFLNYICLPTIHSSDTSPYVWGLECSNHKEISGITLQNFLDNYENGKYNYINSSENPFGYDYICAEEVEHTLSEFDDFIRTFYKNILILTMKIKQSSTEPTYIQTILNQEKQYLSEKNGLKTEARKK